jgi:hypothetical protein
MAGAWYEIVGGLGAAVGGVGAAVGGTAAWRAASASKDASRDAADALALGLKPLLALEAIAVADPEGSEQGKWSARIHNASPFSAVDIVLEARFRDGERVRREVERLGSMESETVLLRNIAAPPAGPSPEQAGEGLALRYSDERRLARYEIQFAFITQRVSGAPTGNVMVSGEPKKIE